MDIGLATAILVALTPLLAWRWRRVALAIGMPLSERSAFTIVLIGMFFNQVLPSAIGGDVMRLWLLRGDQISIAKGISSIFLDRMVSLVGMMLVVVVGAFELANIVREPAMQLGAVLMVAGVIGGTAVFVWSDRIPWPSIFQSSSLIRNISIFAQDARALFFSPLDLSAVLIASILIHVQVSMAIWLLARGLGLTTGIDVFVLLLPLVFLLSMLPISIAGWGMREGAMVACLALVGVDATSAFAVSALFGVVSVFASLPGGIVWLFVGRGHKRKDVARQMV